MYDVSPMNIFVRCKILIYKIQLVFALSADQTHFYSETRAIA